MNFPSCQAVAGTVHQTVELSGPSSAVAAAVLPFAFCVEAVFLASFLDLRLASLVPWGKIQQVLQKVLEAWYLPEIETVVTLP